MHICKKVTINKLLWNLLSLKCPVVLHSYTSVRIPNQRVRPCIIKLFSLDNWRRGCDRILELSEVRDPAICRNAPTVAAFYRVLRLPGRVSHKSICLIYFFRQGLMCPRLALNSLHSWQRPWTFGSFASTSPVLGQLEYLTIPGLCGTGDWTGPSSILVKLLPRTRLLFLTDILFLKQGVFRSSISRYILLWSLL